MDDARDMYSSDVTATFRERRRLKGKKLYGNYAVEETIIISMVKGIDEMKKFDWRIAKIFIEIAMKVQIAQNVTPSRKHLESLRGPLWKGALWAYKIACQHLPWNLMLI